MKKLSPSKQIAYLGILTALYVVLGFSVKIPIVSHIGLDLGYVVFAFACILLGWKGAIVGAAGCAIESTLLYGMFPIGWILGQLLIGVACGTTFAFCRKNNCPIAVEYIVSIAVIVVSILLGVGLLKTVVECSLYEIPYAVKIPKNMSAALTDIVTMCIGYIVSRSIIKHI